MGFKKRPRCRCLADACRRRGKSGTLEAIAVGWRAWGKGCDGGRLDTEGLEWLVFFFHPGVDFSLGYHETEIMDIWPFTQSAMICIFQNFL